MLSRRPFTSSFLFAAMILALMQVWADPPADYYQSVTTQTGELLHQELQLIVSGQRGYAPVDLSYDNARLALSNDVDSLGSGLVRLFYTNEARPADEWPEDQSREHAWPQSYGADERPAFSDMHHLFLCDQGINSTRNNRLYASIDGGTAVPNPTGDPDDQNYYDDDHWETSLNLRGDAARAIFFMETRYADFTLIDRGGVPGVDRMGYLSDLLLWHQQDPVDDFERTRNDKVFTYQNNRNPYIDHPEWVEMVYTPANVMDNDTVTVEVVNIAPRAVFPGTSAAMLAITFTADSNEWDAGLLRLDKNGTLADQFVEAIVYHDLNLDGQWDNSDAEIARQEFLSGSTTLILDPVVRSAPGFPQTLFIVADLDGADHSGDTLQIVLQEDGLVYSATGGDDFNPSQAPVPSSFTTLTQLPSEAVFFSEYIEGSSNNKALEVFNSSSAHLNLTGWKVEFYFNGNQSPTPSDGISLEGSIPPRSTFVLADDEASTPVLSLSNQISISPFFNGDDAIVLKDSQDNIADSIGRVGEQSVWGTSPVTTQNHTLRRKTSVITGDKTPTDVYTPVSEWESCPQDTFDDLGEYYQARDGWVVY